jgi:hypothetical protein
MRSPLMDWDGGPPQIKSPPRGRSRTAFPGEPFTLGHIEPTGQPQNPDAYLGPGRPEQESPQQEPPDEGASWWRRAVR